MNVNGQQEHREYDSSRHGTIGKDKEFVAMNQLGSYVQGTILSGSVSYRLSPKDPTINFSKHKCRTWISQHLGEGT